MFRKTYELDHPDVHAYYRELFSAVDRYNKLALACNTSVQYSVRTLRWTSRFYMAMLACSETNAWIAHTHRQAGLGLEQTSRVAWKLQLAEALCSNPFSLEVERPLTRSTDQTSLV